MNTYTADPGARVLWCLRRKRTDVRCVLFFTRIPVEVHVFHDSDLVLKEVFADEPIALSWAEAYSERLKEQGWHDSPEERSPSSAA